MRLGAGDAEQADSMGHKVQVAYVDSGVPFLSSKDIFKKVGYGEQGTAIRAGTFAKGAFAVRLLGQRKVRIDLAGLEPTSIEIRDLRGRKVMDWNRQVLAGKTSVVWNGRNPSGISATSGLYVVVVRTAERMLTAAVALP